MSTVGKPHKVYKLLARGPQFCGVPAHWFFGFVLAGPFAFFIGRFVGGLPAACIGLGLVAVSYAAACFYVTLDPTLVPLTILKMRGVEFPEETTSYLPRSQEIKWKEKEDE